uniref:RRM domain-containing protein n=1 Tax=Esox lucius TaxID=8010 RepID=A0AAY5L8V4_ESOLU
MENNHHKIHGEKHPQHWRSCKLIIDPALKNGFHKVYRYDGQHFNMPVKDLGVFPVDTVRDPRIFHIWTKFRDIDLLVPKFKIDECYVGPPKEVTFARLNDNVKESFLTDMCKKYGQIEEVEILYNPKNKKHLGIAKVIFDTVKAAKDSVEHLHGISVMGNIIHVELDPEGKNRMLYFHLLVSGLYTPWTLPLGSDDALQSLTNCFQDSKPLHRLTDGISQLTQSIFSPASVATPLSLDTAYSSICQDTPGSFGQTPLSLGTPRTPCLSVTPLSQDSCYSSQHTTPVHQISQAEHSFTCGAHRRLRRDVCYYQPGRPYVRSHQRNSELSSLLKPMQPPHARLPLQFQTQASDRGYKSSRYQNPPSLAVDNPVTEPPLHLSGPEQESFGVPSLPPPSESFPLGSRFARAQSVNMVPLKERPPSPLSEPDVDISDCSPGSPAPAAESHSLDSRIEMLLRKTSGSCPSLHGETAVDAPVPSQDSPASPSFPVFMDSPEPERNPGPGGSPTASPRNTTGDGLEDVSPNPLPECEGDKLITEVPAPIWTSQPPRPSGTHSVTPRERSEAITKGHADPTTSDKKNIRREHHSLSLPQRLHEPMENEDISDGERSGTSVPKCNGSEGITDTSVPFLPHCLPVSSISHPVPVPSSNPHNLLPFSNPPPPITPFNLPIRFPPSNPPPHIRCSVPPIPVPLSSGVIPIPPPGFPLLPPPVRLRGTPPPMAAPPSVLQPFYPYPLNTLHAVHLDRVNSVSGCGGMPVSFAGPPWPLPPIMPAFDPSVPPPGYRPLLEDPRKATVEKVLAVVTVELKSIVKKDINRKIIEGIAFRAFDEWWNSQEQKAKSITSVKAREGLEDVMTKPRDLLKQIIGQHGARTLPSFRVKRKESDDATTSGDSQRKWPTSPVNEVLDNAVLESEIINGTSDRSPKHLRFPAVRRRHARPLELDSEGEEEEISREKEEQPMTNKEENTATADTVSQHKEDEDDDVDEQKEEVDQDKDNDDNDQSTKMTRVLSPNEEDAKVSLSEAESHPSKSSEYLSDSSPSEVSEDSSDYDSSSDQETEGGDREVECVVLSSDEEEMVVESPATPPAMPSAPLTPGTQLDFLDESELVLRDQPWEEQRLVCVNGGALGFTRRTCPGMDLLPSQNERDLLAPSPIALPVVETDVEVQIGGFEWSAQSPDIRENLRPLTPTGSLVDSDSDLLFKRKSTPPAGLEVELPRTPGRGAGAVLESEEDNLHRLFSLSPTDSELFSQHRTTHPPAAASYLVYEEDRPRTPGKDDGTLWNPPTPWRAPVTPGRGTCFTEGGPGFSPPSCSPLSTSLYIRTPRTPGRDFMPIKRTLQNAALIKASPQRTNATASSCNESPADSAISASSPISRSESLSEAADSGDVWPIPHLGPRSRAPQQGLEVQRARENCPWRRVQRRMRWRERRRTRRRQRMSSVQRAVLSSGPSASPCFRRRSQREETVVLHGVWREGLDEEDAKLLEETYDRLLQQDNGFSWLSDTLWVPHPHILYHRLSPPPS